MSMETELAKFSDALDKHTYDDTTHFGEMRLALQNLESEAAELKRIALETHAQSLKTNGSVAELIVYREQIKGGMKVAIPALTLLVAAMGWLTVDYLNHRDVIPVDKIQAAVDAAFKQNLQK